MKRDRLLPPPNVFGRRACIAAVFVLLAPALGIGIASNRAWLANNVVSSSIPSGTVGWIDAPASETIVGTKIRLAGWALDPAGIQSVEVRVDGQARAARYGLVRDDVAKAKPGYPDSAAPGFEFDGEFATLAPARHLLSVVARN